MSRHLSILAVDDDEEYRSLLQTVLSELGHEVQTAPDGIAAINTLQKENFDLVLLDIDMPRVGGVEVLKFIKQTGRDAQVLMISGTNDLVTAVECIKLGAYDYLTKPCSVPALNAAVNRAAERWQLMEENRALKAHLANTASSTAVIARSAAFKEVLTLALKVAPTGSNVLIHGPSGTGKEVVAGFIHKNSERSNQPFIAVNSASIPDALLESEFFGHEKGAFTDASAAKQGLVEIADGGTLFLDEIGDISPAIQPKLLRFIQTGEYRRVGGTKNLRSNVRLISATNKDLASEVTAGRFREDLLYRINVFTIEIPPLKDRKDDIPALVENFLRRRFGEAHTWTVSDDAMQVLMNYSWPGNVRELENAVERATIVSSSRTVDVRDLAVNVRQPASATATVQGIEARFPAVGSAATVQEIEKSHIHAVLLSVAWDKPLAAKILGFSLKTLYTKIQAFSLKP